MPIHRLWVYVVGGRLQTLGSSNGSIQMWHQLECEFARPCEQYVQFLRWRDNMSDVAEHAWQLRPLGNPSNMTVIICGYSWGGFSATLLAKQFRRRGVKVKHMILCDAVYRHWYHLGQWRALVPWSTINIPDNVKNVAWAVQRNSLPSGHTVKACDSVKTAMSHYPVLLEAEHNYADEDPWYLETARLSIQSTLLAL